MAERTTQSPPNRLPPSAVTAALFVAAFLIRLVFIPNPGFEADVSFWKSWGIAPFDHGIVWSMHHTNNNYPTPFAYLLWFLTWVYSWFSDPHAFDTFWSNTNTLFLTVAKMPSIIADLVIGAFFLWAGKNAKRIAFPQLPFGVYILLACAYLLNPIPILDGALWGQVDALGVAVFLVAFGAAITRRPFLAGLLYMVALMTKLQTMIYGPLFFLFLWQDMGLPGLIRGLAGATTAFFGLNIEFLLARDMGRVMASLTDNYDYFPLMSLNAYNLWWLVAGGHGMQVSDKIATIGFSNAKSVGLTVFSSGYLLAALTQLRPTAERLLAGKGADQDGAGDRQERIFHFLTALIIAVAAFFLFQTESHDRYAFPIVVFFLLWLPFLIHTKLAAKQREEFWKTAVFRTGIIGYAAFSFVYFLNLHTALIDNYPHNGIALLNALNTPPVTMAIAVVQLGLFAWYVAATARVSGVIAQLLTTTALLIGLIAPNLPLLTKRPVALSSLTPATSHQEYGARTKNMPVNAGADPNTWTRLSVQYAFYQSGIGTHAASKLVYDVNRKFSRLTTDVGIDTEAGPQGSARFEIWGDGKLLASSDTVKRFELPRHLTADIRGVKSLELIVTNGGDGNTDDHADWLNTMLWP